MWVVCRVLLWIVDLVFVGALSGLRFVWVHLGALSYTFCIIGWCLL
jgi:hypothetical protein